MPKTDYCFRATVLVSVLYRIVNSGDPRFVPMAVWRIGKLEIDEVCRVGDNGSANYLVSGYSGERAGCFA